MKKDGSTTYARPHRDIPHLCSRTRKTPTDSTPPKSCGTCEACLDGYRQYCADACGFAFGELDQGSMGDRAIRDEAFVYRIPDSIKSEHAAPLMCAGVHQTPLSSYRGSSSLG